MVSPFLKIGETTAVFHSSGTVLVWMAWLKIFVKKIAISWCDDLRIFDGMAEIPAPLEESNFVSSCSTIIAVVGTNENVLVEILFWCFKSENVWLIYRSLLPLVAKEVDDKFVKNKLKMLPNSSGFVDVWSLHLSSFNWILWKNC